MTLKTLLNRIGKVAIGEKLVHYFLAGTSLYQLNPQSVAEYPALVLIPTGNHRVELDTTTFEITIYDLDRLLEDFSNSIDIYSSTVEELKNLVLKIREIDGVVDVSDGYTIRNFAAVEGMDDRLYGSYAVIRITVVNVRCPED